MIQAIITGDIVHSSRMSVGHREWLFKQIADALKQWNKDFGMRSEIFRGDSFQCLVKNSADALKLTLLIKTYIRSLNPSKLYEVIKKEDPKTKREIIFPTWIFDARIAIGIGEIEFLSNKLASSGGKAFQLSGQLLDKIKNKKQSLAIATEDRFKEELETEFILLDALISRTTALQCEVINLKLLGYTEHQIAENLEVGQSAINQRSKSGNWKAIETILKRFEQIYANEN